MKIVLLNSLKCVSGAVLLISLLAGCGTTSEMRRPAGATPASLAPYDRVVVKDFADRFSGNMSEEQNQARDVTLDVTRIFADAIADEIRKTGVFQQVARGARDGERTLGPSTIAITGDITSFERGRGALRTFVGHGAGRSEFDAIVQLRDGESNQLLGTVVVDRNSWPLPGAVAGAQTPETFMRAAAEKVARELQKAKTGLPTGSVEER